MNTIEKNRQISDFLKFHELRWEFLEVLKVKKVKVVVMVTKLKFK